MSYKDKARKTERQRERRRLKPLAEAPDDLKPLTEAPLKPLDATTQPDHQVALSPRWEHVREYIPPGWEHVKEYVSRPQVGAMSNLERLGERPGMYGSEN